VSEKPCSQWMRGQAIFLSSVAVNPCQDKPTKLQCFLKRAFHASSVGVAALPLAGRGSSACSLKNYSSQMTMRSGPPPSLTALPSLCRRELLETTCRLANTLKRHGVHRGDRVAIYMPVSPLAVAAMLACARIGAIHTVVFAGFSAGSLAGRINDGQSGEETDQNYLPLTPIAKCKVVITFNQGLRGGRVVELKKIVDEAIKLCPTVQHVLEMAKEEPVCAPESMGSEDTLFLLYTSGSTGTPKGLVHTQAGYLLYAALTHRFVFDYWPGDVFGCVADIGWITGHSYVVYGPLCNGVTSVLFESTPVYPDAGRYWEMVQRLKISQFYGAPTAFRLLLKFEDSWVKKYDRSSLRTLGSVGEPINQEAWEWLHRVVGDSRCTLVDTWWQTGEHGNVLKGGDVSGALCLSQAWPGMARTIFGDHQRFMDSYFEAYPGVVQLGVLPGAQAMGSQEKSRTPPWRQSRWLQASPRSPCRCLPGLCRVVGWEFTYTCAPGNRCSAFASMSATLTLGEARVGSSYLLLPDITGRMDDVINISGHRLGTAEIEDAMADHPAVPETAVIGYPHDIKGEGSETSSKNSVWKSHAEAPEEDPQEGGAPVPAQVTGNYKQSCFLQKRKVEILFLYFYISKEKWCKHICAIYKKLLLCLRSWGNVEGWRVHFWVPFGLLEIRIGNVCASV
ncbi:hypothetical protein E2I00_017605, partial [Balaenoptera physalus]